MKGKSHLANDVLESSNDTGSNIDAALKILLTFSVIDVTKTGSNNSTEVTTSIIRRI